MNITIKRTQKNELYTEGLILIRGKKIAHTVEHTLSMLPAGHYQVRLCKNKAKRRIISIIQTDWSIGISSSWIGSRKHHVIAIGQSLIPGAVYRSTSIYERLFDRIEKCPSRRERIHLFIDETQCVNNKPIQHWKA